MSVSSVSNRPRVAPQTAPSTNTVGGTAPSGELRRGMTGDAVRQLQADLVKLGFMTQRQMNTGAGHFGPRTFEALKAFQAAHHLAADGVYGPRTREALQQALRPDPHGKDVFEDGPQGPGGTGGTHGTGGTQGTGGVQNGGTQGTGQNPAELARQYLGRHEHELKRSGELPMNPNVPNDVCCANFVSAVLERTGQLRHGEHTDSVATLRNTMQRDGWVRVDAAHAQPGDVAIVNNGHHVVLVNGRDANGALNTIGSNNRRDLPGDEQVISISHPYGNPEYWHRPGPSTPPASTPPVASRPTPSTPSTPSTPTPSAPTPTADRPHPTGRLGEVYADNSRKAANAQVSNDPRYAAELRSIANMSPERRRQIDEIARRADLPPALVAGIWYREASLRDGVYLHNGDPLGRPTTHVPRGIFFRQDQFVEAAVDALRSKRSTQQALNLHYNSTDLGAMASYAEAYNGYGYRNHGVSSPYAFAGTNQYHGGLYVADGQFSASTYDRRLGVVAVAQEYMRTSH